MFNTENDSVWNDILKGKKRGFVKNNYPNAGWFFQTKNHMFFKDTSEYKTIDSHKEPGE